MKEKWTNSVIPILILLALTSGCVSKTYTYGYSPRASDGTIVIYRTFALVPGRRDAVVELNGEDILELANREYSSIKVPPGSHRISVRALANKDIRDVTIRENEKVYLQVHANSVLWFNLLLLCSFFGCLIDDPWVAVFLLRESSEGEFSSVTENLQEKRIVYVPLEAETPTTPLAPVVAPSSH